MATEAQVLANRRNAAKSTGPHTPEGKAIVAQNAVKHGLLARRAVLKDEDPAEFELHRSRMLQSLAPEEPEQEKLAERIVVLWWQLRRAECVQVETLDYLIAMDRASEWVTDRRSRGDPSAAEELTVGRVVAKDFANARTLDHLSILERRIESSLCRMMNELRRLKGCETKPMERVRSAECGVRNEEGDSPVCETKPIAATVSVDSAPHRANVPVRPESCGDARPTQETPDGVTTNRDDLAKQSQSEGVSGSTPAPGGDPSRGRLGHMAADPSCETKPIEATETVSMVPARASKEETPGGVTTNKTDCAKQSQSETAESGHDPSGEAAKQSQCQPPTGIVRTLLRARPRVAYHYHNVGRSC